MTCKHNEYVKYVDPTSITNSAFLVGHRSRAHRLCPLCIMHVHSAHVHACLIEVLVKVVDIICPSCTIMQMKDAYRVCALRALVVIVIVDIKSPNLEI